MRSRARTYARARQLEKDGDISEDIARDLADDMQKTVDAFVKKIEERCKAKEEELNKVRWRAGTASRAGIARARPRASECTQP